MQRIQKRDLLPYILLSFVTCGIYSYYWLYKMNTDMNILCQNDGSEPMESSLVVILGIVTGGIYTLYWIYKQGNRMNAKAQSYGIRAEENGTSYLMWMIFGSLMCCVGAFIGLHLFIKNFNVLVDHYNL